MKFTRPDTLFPLVLLALLVPQASSQETVLWEVTQTFPPTFGVQVHDVAHDLDGDGWNELWSTNQGFSGSTHTRLVDGRTGAEVFDIDFGSPPALLRELLTIDDVTGDGVPDGFARVERSDSSGGTLFELALIDGSNGVVLQRGLPPGASTNLGYGLELLDDLNGDGARELGLVESSYDALSGVTIESLRVWDPAAWTTLFTYAIPNVSLPSNCTFFGSNGRDLQLVGDIDGDGTGELAISDTCSSFSGNELSVLILNPRTGATVVELSISSPGSFANLFALPDWNGDGLGELGVLQGDPPLFGSTVSTLRVLEPSSLTELHSETVSGFAKNGLHAVGDVTGDGVSELVADFGDRVELRDAEDLALRYDFSDVLGSEYVGTGVPSGIQRPAFLVSVNSGEILPSFPPSLLLRRFDNPVRFQLGGLGGACHGLAADWSGWFPNLRGNPTQVELSGAEPGAGALLLLGVPGVAGPFVPPLDLSFFGAPGCGVLVAPLVVEARTADASGESSVSWNFSSVPPALIGTLLHMQWVATSTMNPLGLATSDAWEFVLLP